MVNTEAKNQRRALEAIQSLRFQLEKQNDNVVGMFYNIVYEEMEKRKLCLVWS